LYYSQKSNDGKITKKEHVNEKVNQSHYRSGQTLKIPEGLRPPDFKTVGI
jgi:hypothetical protein